MIVIEALGEFTLRNGQRVACIKHRGAAVDRDIRNKQLDYAGIVTKTPMALPTDLPPGRPGPRATVPFTTVPDNAPAARAAVPYDPSAVRGDLPSVLIPGNTTEAGRRPRGRRVSAVHDVRPARYREKQAPADVDLANLSSSPERPQVASGALVAVVLPDLAAVLQPSASVVSASVTPASVASSSPLAPPAGMPSTTFGSQPPPAEVAINTASVDASTNLASIGLSSGAVWQRRTGFAASADTGRR